MDNDQITSLAREYAEETVSHTRLSTTIADDTEDVIRFLLSRYCLVEKSKIVQIHQAKQHILANQNAFGTTVTTEAAAQQRLMLYLFPEIAKEVE